ncbi:MAG: DUF3373 family protein [Epsilonproteobacteria bacterium]|nr:DUF3373 family protein [Campylobacterota bacterium]
MNKIMLSLAVISGLSLSAFSDEISDMKVQIDNLTKKIEKLEKKQKRTQKTLNKVKTHDAFDNVKFGIDFRNAVDVLDYKDNETGETAKNDSLLSSRLYLTMKSSPMSGLTFTGKLAVYSLWGGPLYDTTSSLKTWSASSKATDTVMRVKEAYFVYTDAIGEQPISFSIGRRPSTNGFLANYRENEKEAGSPLAHITNMEVDAAMVKLDWSRFLLEGSYTKFIYGRAHAGNIENVYGTDTTSGFTTPYADVATDDDDPVDFAILLGDAYNNGQHQVMYEWAHIFNTKGHNTAYPDDQGNSKAAGTADLYALSYKMEGVGDEISDFLDDTILFASIAGTYYNAKDGYSLLGSEDGGSKSGYSYWVGALIPDMITEDGKFGFEYNHGSQYWTPMTWAEDTAIGSKIAVRGDAYEAYWNFNLFGIKYLPGQIRYTYVQHDYTPNNHCMGWVAPEEVDITAQDIRAFVSYRY